jgi:hypothetical protein
MRKNLTRIVIGLAILLAAVSAIYQFAWERIRTSLPLNYVHTAEKNSPYGSLDATLIRIEPYDATFEIPVEWLTPKPIPTPAKNLHLSYQDLNDLYWNDGSDAEEAKVINSVLSFQDCAAHFGDMGWGNYMWNDLQGRLYVVNLTPEELRAAIELYGLPTARANFERAKITDGSHDAWSLRTLDILDAPSWSDLILGKRLDFYYRRFGDKTIVVVFLHTDKFEKEINLILDSFHWPSPDSNS